MTRVRKYFNKLQHRFFPYRKPVYHDLKNKWTRRHREIQKSLWEKHGEALKWAINTVPSVHSMASGALGGILLLSAPLTASLPLPTQSTTQEASAVDPSTALKNSLSPLVPLPVTPLTSDEEEKIGIVLTNAFGFKTSAELDGKKLNRSYGLIGQEQHLMRYPGDSIYSHFGDSIESQKLAKYGMAPGRGAWGYFANSKTEMTEKDIEREKYYIAVQTFLIPDYNYRVAEYRNFFKFRKMLVVNPENGKAVVAVIGDAGPAPWTGKHLGGSPEAMQYLERFDGAQRGPVLYFFIDDPDDTIPLGPITPGNQ